MKLEAFYQQVVRSADGQIIRQRQHPAQAFVHRRVCAQCNSGWMSDLENQAKPLLLPLIEGDRSLFALTPDERLTLAKWSCKTAYILSHAALQNKPVGVDHLRHLATHSKMPDGVGVFAGKHRPTGAVSLRQKNTWFDPQADPSFGTEIEPGSSYKIAVQVKHLLVLVCFRPEAGVRHLLAVGVHIPLWPIERVYPAYYGGFEMPTPYDSRAVLERFSTSLAAMHPPSQTRLIWTP